MQLTIAVQTGYLRIELVGRRSAQETRQALEEAIGACRRHGVFSVLAVVRASHPIFKVQQYGLPTYLAEAAASGEPWKVALVSDSAELRAAHEYVATLARQKRLKVRAFGHEPEAIQWLRGAADLGRRYRFTRVVIAGAPHEPGVYTLWQHEEVIYYGRAQGDATLRSRLLEHLDGGVQATHYSWEISREPAARERELLGEFRRAFGRLPRLNGDAA
jgi:hypothetical protein